MPRRLKVIRRPVPRPKTDTPVSRAEIIRHLVDHGRYPDASSESLKHTPEAERAAMVDAALALFYEERAARRRPVLKERLENSTPDAWGVLFCEEPELEDELTAEQRSKWESWRDEARRAILRESQKNVITMPPTKEPIQ